MRLVGVKYFTPGGLPTQGVINDIQKLGWKVVFPKTSNELSFEAGISKLGIKQDPERPLYYPSIGEVDIAPQNSRNIEEKNLREQLQNLLASNMFELTGEFQIAPIGFEGIFNINLVKTTKNKDTYLSMPSLEESIHGLERLTGKVFSDCQNNMPELIQIIRKEYGILSKALLSFKPAIPAFHHIGIALSPKYLGEEKIQSFKNAMSILGGGLSRKYRIDDNNKPTQLVELFWQNPRISIIELIEGSSSQDLQINGQDPTHAALNRPDIFYLPKLEALGSHSMGGDNGESFFQVLKEKFDLSEAAYRLLVQEQIYSLDLLGLIQTFRKIPIGGLTNPYSLNLELVYQPKGNLNFTQLDGMAGNGFVANQLQNKKS